MAYSSILKKHLTLLIIPFFQRKWNIMTSGVALDWFASYLSYRKQYVFVNGHASDYLDICCGVPQGSVLGPLLFLIYINDLSNVSNPLSFYLFADDTNIYFEASDLFTLQKVMSHELQKIKKWLDANKLAQILIKPIT